MKTLLQALQALQIQIKKVPNWKKVKNIFLWLALSSLFIISSLPNFFNTPTEYLTETVLLPTESCFSFSRVEELLKDRNFGTSLINLSDNPVTELNLQPEIVATTVKTLERKETPNVSETASHSKKTKDISGDILNKIIYIKEGIDRSTWRKMSAKKRGDYYDSYIIRFWNIAQEEYYNSGVHPLLILGRGARESQCATSNLYMKSNNMFCIKFSKHWHRQGGVFSNADTQEWADDDPDDEFFKFESTWAALRGFTLFINRTKYTKHLKWGDSRLKDNSLTQWSYALCQGGYSTTCETSHDVDAGKKILKRAKELGLPMYLDDYNL